MVRDNDHAGEEALRHALRRMGRKGDECQPLAVALLNHAAAMRRHADAVESLLLGGLVCAMIDGLSLAEVRDLAFAVGVSPDELGDTLTEAVRALVGLALLEELLDALRARYPHVLEFVL